MTIISKTMIAGILIIIVACVASIWLTVVEMKADAWMEGFSLGSRP